MPIYSFRNKETGAIAEVILRISDYDQYLSDNPNLERYYDGVPGLISSSKTPLRQAGNEWRNHLDRIKKGSGKGNTIKT
jgi:hypothetical protein